MRVWGFSIVNSEIVYVYTDGSDYWEVEFHGVKFFSNKSGYAALDALNTALKFELVA